VKRRIDAKNGLESYLYNLKSTLEDPEKAVSDKISAEEKVRTPPYVVQRMRQSQWGCCTFPANLS
jgi:hypothetical protein